MTAALLTLADSRLPAGGHTHSGGVEQAIAAGLVHDPRSLEVFLRRRLLTSGAVAAGVAAAAARVGISGRLVSGGGDSGGGGGEGGDGTRAVWAALDAETDARTPSPALRRASRQQGRGLVRVGRRAWPSAAWDDLPDHPHHPLALGAAAVAAGLTAQDAARAAAYLTITGPATAAQRLLAMDPITVATVTARLAAEVDAVAARVDDPTAGDPTAVDPAAVAAEAWLPADTDPLLDLLAEVHADRGDRYFAS